MTKHETNFYDDEKNVLLVRKKDDGTLLDHIYIHMDDPDGINFIACFDSYKSDNPSTVYILSKISNVAGLTHYPTQEIKVSKEEQIWKRIRIEGSLPSTWRMYFNEIKEIIMKNTDNNGTKI